jgi:hypothetical protein
MAAMTEIHAHNNEATKFVTLVIRGDVQNNEFVMRDGQKNEINEESVKREPEPVKSRSRLRLFAILGALFVRTNCSYLHIHLWRHGFADLVLCVSFPSL